jgi:tetratricopeptide (TPR) repeat protein
VPAILATLAAIGIFYPVARTALAAANPLVAAELPPKEYSRLLRVRLYQLMAPQGRVTPDVVALARQAAAAEPLAFEPYYVLARAAEQAGRLPEAIRLMEEARLRRRNFAPTRLQLAAYYVHAGRLPEVLHELEVVLGLRPETIEPVMAELTKLLATGDGRTVLADALSRDPAWREQFFAVARARSVTPAQALALMEAMRARRPNADLRLERQLYITSLIGTGQLRQARRMWLDMLPEAERPRHRLMSNPAFRGRPVGAPFGWDLRALDVGRAELRDAGTPRPWLEVDYFGGSNAVLAEQLLALPAGSYRLRYELGGEAGTGSSNLYWSLSCHSGSPELARMEMNRPSARMQPHEKRFTVPAGCDGQRLRLQAEAGDVPATLVLRIAGLEIVQ